MLNHKFIIDKLSEAQKISILSDVRKLSSEEYTKLGIPPFNISAVEEYCKDLYPSPASLSNSWNPGLIADLAFDMGVRMTGENINAAYVPSSVARLGIFDFALTEDPYLSAKISAEYLNSMSRAGIAPILDGALLDENDVASLDKTVNRKLLNEFVIRPIHNTVYGKRCNGVVVGSDIDVKGYERVNSEIIEKISNSDGKAFDNAYILCKNIQPDETVERIVKGHICLDGSETVLKVAIDRYKRLKSSISKGKVSVCELEAEIESGNAFAPEKIDEAVDRVLSFAFACAENNKESSASHPVNEVALKNAVYESTVLLKNNANILPLNSSSPVAVIGDILVNYNCDEEDKSAAASDIMSYMRECGCDANLYLRGYSMLSERNDAMISAFPNALVNNDTVILFMGMTHEGDQKAIRTQNLYLPANQIAAVDKLRSLGKKIIAVVSSDIPFDVSFADQVDALMLAPLNTRYSAQAVIDIITGRQSPRGKLSKSLYKDTEHISKKQRYYLNMPKTKVGTFIGYRYYDSADYDIAYPFGFGLGYSKLVYSSLSITGSEVSFTVRNKGKIPVTEIVQVYIELNNSKRLVPKKELAGFDKITVHPESAVTVRIPLANLERFDPQSNRWVMEQGEYTVYVGASVRDIRLSGKVSLGNAVLNPVSDRACDYLQSKTNIISDSYTLEADYKLMKKNMRNIIFGTGALVLAVAMFLFSVISGKVAIFFNIIAAILAVAGIVMFVLESSDRKKSHDQEREQINKANKKAFEDAKKVSSFSTAEMFSEEFDRAGKNEVRVKTPVQARADNYLEYVNEDITYETAVNSFIAFAASLGYKFEVGTVRELFASMSASRLIVTRGISNDVFNSFISVLSQYFGTPVSVDAVDDTYVNEENALFTKNGTAKQRTELAKAINFAASKKELVKIAALTEVTFAEISNYFVPFARYARNPRNSVVVEATGENNAREKFCFSENLWIFINLKMGETFSNIPAYISEIASVIKIDYSVVVPEALEQKLEPFSYYQFDFMLEKIKSKNGISEETWKRIDALESFVNSKSSYAIGNRVCIAIERFYAVFTACGGDSVEALDRAMSARIIPSAVVALNDLENVEDKNLSEKLDMIFGEDKVEFCHSAIRASGSTVL